MLITPRCLTTSLVVPVGVALLISVACSSSSDPGGGGGGHAGVGGAGYSGGGNENQGGHDGGAAGTGESGAGGDGGAAGTPGGADGGDSGAAGATDGGAGGAGNGALCADRRGGALIVIRVASETLQVWITDKSFIAEATRLLEANERRNANFYVLAGTDCDARYNWHPDPTNASFSDINAEVCDGLPSTPLTAGSIYCPWGVHVLSVREQ